MVSIGYKAVSTTTPAVPPATMPSAKSAKVFSEEGNKKHAILLIRYAWFVEKF